MSETGWLPNRRQTLPWDYFRVARYPLVMGHRQLRQTRRFLNNGTSQISFGQGRFVTPEIERH